MELSKLPRITGKRKRRMGRGHGSGRVKTAGRGTKGQKAKGKVKPIFEGGALTIIKRLPLLRGKGKNKSLKKKPVIVNIKFLNLLPKEAVVTTDTLIKYKIVDEQEAKTFGVKILGDGQLTIPLTVKLPTSKGARAKIEKAKGKVLT